MRIAIPVENDSLCLHFGHCANFVIVDLDEPNKKVLSKEVLEPPPHEPGLLPRWLSEKGVNKVIAGGMGARAIDLFKQSHVEVIVGVRPASVDAIIADYLSGCLTSGSNVCDH